MILTNIILILVYTGLNIGLAYYDSVKIKKGFKIRHGLNALIYTLLILPVYIGYKDVFQVIGLLSLRRVVFDTALNLFRGLRFDYISSHATSIIDRISYRFQAKFGYLPYYSIFILITILSIFL